MNYSYVIYRMVSFTMILSDCSAFQGCSIFKIKYVVESHIRFINGVISNDIE